MDLLRRIRWGNVARAAALLTAVALVLAWPFVRSDPPPLPPEPALAEPPPAPEFAVEAPPVAEAPGRAERRAPRQRRTRKRERAGGPPPARVERATEQRLAPVEPASGGPGRVAPPAPAGRGGGGVRRAPAPPAPRSEFGFEGG